MAIYNKGSRFPKSINDWGDIYYSFSHETPVRPRTIKYNGYVRYTSQSGQTHRTDGPAVIDANGHRLYRVHGIAVSPEQFFLQYGVM